MSFKPGDIVITNHGGIGIYKGPSTAATSHGKVDFFAINCTPYTGKNFYLNHINEENLTLATKDHPKYKCVECILSLCSSKKPSKDTLTAFKALNPNVNIGTIKEKVICKEQVQELMKKDLLSDELIEKLRKQNII